MKSSVLVLGVEEFTRKDGTRAARLVVASTPRNSSARGMAAASLDVLPEVAERMSVFPAIYDLTLDLPIGGFGGRSEVRPVVVGATLVAPVVPDKVKNANA
ncbi:hypothetical protein [Thermus filiformis]|uniref:hypothetical protein n=1 Tax=Thermus filiformis TaxID=276 RepID=UPI00126A472E|nr:hypothetical protein [Thermus filiformis]